MVLSEELGGAAPGHAMRIERISAGTRGLTRLEVVVIVFGLVMLGLTLAPALASAKRKGCKIQCANNLSQVGFAFRIWESNHGESVQTAIPAATNRVPAPNAMDVLQAMSNELSTPYILYCPSDKRCRQALGFDKHLTASNVSYFVDMTADESILDGILAGDDNFEIGGTPIETGLWEISSNTPIAWSADRHKFCGNVAMADGSVQGFNNSMLRERLQSTNVTPMHLSIP